MRRRNFIKIFAGALAGVATGVGLAKKKEDPLINGGAGYWEGVTIIDDSKPDQLTAADLKRARAYFGERVGGSLPDGYPIIVVHKDIYDRVKMLKDKYDIPCTVIKERLTDRDFITISALSKKARGFK